MLKTTESSPSLSPDWFSDCFSPKITARLGFPRLRDLPVVLPFPICGSPVSSVLAPGWRSLLPAPCNEREYLSVFAREKEGERDNFVRSYCVLGALPEITVFSAQRPCDIPSCCPLLSDQSDGWSVLQKLAASVQWVKKKLTGDVGSPDVMSSASRDIPSQERSA